MMIDSIKNDTLGEYIITAVFISFIFLPLFFFVHFAPYLRYDIQAFIISANLAFLVLTIFFVNAFQKTKQYNVLSYYDLLLLPFFFFILISFSLVSDHLASFQSVLWWLEALIFYFMSRYVFINTATRKRFLHILPGCGALMTIFFAISLFANEEIKENFLVFPIAMNRNYAAQVLILPFFISLSFMHKTYNRGTRFYAAISAFVIFFGILISRSRSVWLGVLLAIAVAILWLFLAHRAQVKTFLNKQRILISLLMLVVVGMSLFAAHTIMPKYNFPSPVTTLKTFQKPLEGSSGARIRRWTNSLPMIRDHFLFGVGPGNWAHTFYKYRGSVTPDPQGYPHSFNSYLALLGEMGVFAFLLFVVFISSLFRRNYNDSPQVLFLNSLSELFSLQQHST